VADQWRSAIARDRHILDDEPLISIKDTAITEGNTGAAGHLYRQPVGG
jgi:hypothetical protein